LTYTSGIFYDKTGAKELEHAISVVGYGEENGEKYWLIRNSWGEYWGISGFFKLVRGVDNIGITQDCASANPENSWDAYNAEREVKAAKQQEIYKNE